MVGYSPLLARAASSLPPEYDFVSDGLSAEETNILDWADSRLFNNPSFLESRWGPDNWPFRLPPDSYAPTSKFTPENPLPDTELRTASVQAIVLLMLEIDIPQKATGHHVVSWEVDSLDRVLDGLGVYPGLCVHCHGRRGYDTREGIRDNYGPLIFETGHTHREMLKHFAYFAKADGEGILVRSFMDNDLGDFELLHKRGRWHSPVGVGSFNYENISFMSQIRLPDGTLESYPTMVFRMVGNVDTQRQAVERVYDFMRKNLTHYTGDHEAFRDIFKPYTVTPYAPELGWVVHVGEAGSQSASAIITGAFRVLGLKAEQFKTPKKIRNAGSVEVDRETYYYNGNDPFRLSSNTAPVCLFFRTLEQVEDHKYDLDCDK